MPGPLVGDYKGRDALFDYFGTVRSLTGGTMKIEPLSVLSSDRHTAMFTRVTGTREGKTLDVTLAQSFKLDEDGRFVEYWAMADDQDVVDAFWA
ncbi:MAG: nuclear transport factor 2 family protein [Acidimicrobiales bacterium]